ncbi:hypothetical protein [Streptomyces sp. NPDC059894]
MPDRMCLRGLRERVPEEEAAATANRTLVDEAVCHMLGTSPPAASPGA